MPHSAYDVIVAGAGSMGSAACYYLSRRGYSVLGLEQFDTIPHEYGSHAGQSRIIRKAYFEHSAYVPFLERAYANWRYLEELTGEKLYHPTGLLYCGPKEHEVIRGVKEAAMNYSIPLERITDPGMHPYFTYNDGDEMWLEPDAGFLQPEKAIGLYIREAKKNGAVIQTGEKLIHWEKKNGLLHIQTSKADYRSRKLIITAGAWASEAIGILNVPLKVTRQLIVWVEPEEKRPFLPGKFPCWMLAADGLKGVWYGFPYLSGDLYPGPSGLKFALHQVGELTEPDRVNRNIPEKEISDLLQKAKQYFRFAGYRVGTVKTCLYTNTPDEHFIIDHFPGYDGDVAIACGFSGHGFKFASAVGEALAGLIMDGTSSLPPGFLDLKRFGNMAG